jgi:arabinan endo-1,5-alpha-L-arabinosidase
MPILRSKNMAKWEYVSDLFVRKPDWKKKADDWSPQIVYNKTSGYYFMYYCFDYIRDPNHAAAVAISKYPYGPFEDVGKLWDKKEKGDGQDLYPIITKINGVERLFIIYGSHLHVWGIELSIQDMITPIGEPFSIGGNRFEGSTMFEKDGKYWYIASCGMACSFEKSDYRVTVAVADNIKGPYLRKDGVNVEANETDGTWMLHGDPSVGWVGPGGNGEIIKDDWGRYFVLYHAISYVHPALPPPYSFTRRTLMMDEIIWGDDGWPTIENQVPSVTWKRAPHFDPK